MAITIAFDLYGTLLSTASISSTLSTLYGQANADTIAKNARTYQLEYTWRINSMNKYVPFHDLTRSSFRQAASELGITISPSAMETIMDAYNGLDPFPEVPGAMSLLSSKNIPACIFSNGTEDMVSASLKSSELSSEISLPIVSVDPLKMYKPDPRVYQHLAGKSDGTLWLVSSNAWDALGARVAGLESAWIDRAGGGWTDGLGDAMGVAPTVVVRGVDEAVREILRRAS